jgi:predicted DNA-binding transcriptional regulator AlpA
MIDNIPHSSSRIATPAAFSVPAECADDRVLTYPQTATVIGSSVETLRRRIAAGDGPVVTRLSGRRLGVRVKHLRAWLDSRAIAAS